MSVPTELRFKDSEIARALYPWGSIDVVEPRPFDLDARLAELKKGLPVSASTRSHGWRDDFLRRCSGKRGVISDGEARFWLWALTDRRRLTADRKNPAFIDSLTSFHPAHRFDEVERFATWIDAFASHYHNIRLYSQAYLARLLLQLRGLAVALDAVLTYVPLTWTSAFLDELYPSPDDNRNELAAIADSWLTRSLSIGPSYGGPSHDGTLDNTLNRLLPLAGSLEAVRAHVDELVARKITDASTYHVMHADPDDERFMAALDALKPTIGRREVAVLVGRFGVEAIDWLVGRIRAARQTPSPGVVGALVNVRHPRTVDGLLHLAAQTTTANDAEAALQDVDVPFALGLLRAAAGRTKDRELAARLCGQLATSHADAFNEARGLQPEAERASAARAVDAHADRRFPELPAELRPAWLSDLAQADKPSGLPRFCAVKHLEPLNIADADFEFPARAAVGVVDLLRAHDWACAERYALPSMIREAIDPDSAARFVWSIFRDWTRADFPVKHVWCLHAVSEFATDAQILELAAMIEEWPTMDQRLRAYDGLVVLQRHGSASAMAALNRASSSSRFKGIRTRAATALTRAAEKQRLTRAQLEDAIIDDCGLEPTQPTVFSYGSRRFTLIFDQDLLPVVRDDAGNISKGLPRARKADDASVVAEAKAQFKTTKKRVSQVIKLQRHRLELAMGDERRWAAQRWETLYVRHPVVRHIVARLLWQEAAPSGKTRLFRVADDQTFADVKDDELVLNPSSSIALAHPLTMSDVERAAWGELFSDYEIVGPFPQLDRDVYKHHTKDTWSFTEQEALIDPGWLRGHFNRRGWLKATPAEGVIGAVYRDFPRHNLRAYAILSPGLGINYRDDAGQMVTNVRFVIGTAPHWAAGPSRSEVPPIVFSEALFDVRLLTDAAV